MPLSHKTSLAVLTLVGLALNGGSGLADPGSTKLQVVITDAQSGRSLAGQATLVRSHRAAQMSAGGLGQWASLTPGLYTVRCQFKGFRSITKRIRVKAGTTTTVRCRMSVQLPELKQRSRRRPSPPVRAKRQKSHRAMGDSAINSGLGGGGVGGASRGFYTTASTAKMAARPAPGWSSDPSQNTENYSHISENPYHSPTKTPLSTFSIDVDTASYSNVRRMLTNHAMPPADAVKIEELINYFSYRDPAPRGDSPFSVATEVSSAPWSTAHRLVRIGIKGREVDTKELPASNLVFLLDVSGSMSSYDKLPLLKSAFSLLVSNLRAQDKVAIVVYAGAAGVVLPSTSGANKSDILGAIDNLRAGGSTAGGAGIQLAYNIASQNFIVGGNNRIILATDGDFNVGTSSEGALTRLIKNKRKTGVFLTVLGFGSGNYQDAKMEQLADKGNGNHAYIDSILEAKKVLVTEMGGTLLTIAKDVKLQVEFNPSQVKAYRLLGYENRKLADRDFNDDKKDAGDLGAGNSITALYEIIPAGSKENIAGIDELKYQRLVKVGTASDGELLTIKLRYKLPRGNTSRLLSQSVKTDSLVPLAKASRDLRWAASVAEFGMLLRKSKQRGSSSYQHVLNTATAAMGADPEGYRAEFLTLVRKARGLSAPKTMRHMKEGDF